jgi:hypothetical protein
LAAVANQKGTITHYSIFRMQSKLEQRGVQPMNKAYIQMVKLEARRNRRVDLMVSAFCWTITGIGALIGAGFFYVTTYLFLSIGGA